MWKQIVPRIVHGFVYGCLLGTRLLSETQAAIKQQMLSCDRGFTRNIVFCVVGCIPFLHLVTCWLIRLAYLLQKALEIDMRLSMQGPQFEVDERRGFLESLNSAEDQIILGSQTEKADFLRRSQLDGMNERWSQLKMKSAELRSESIVIWLLGYDQHWRSHEGADGPPILTGTTLGIYTKSLGNFFVEQIEWLEQNMQMWQELLDNVFLLVDLFT